MSFINESDQIGGNALPKYTIRGVTTMDYKDWYILQVLYKEKNITKAAEKIFISQPALTYRIKKIEEEFGVELLYRTKRGIKFTLEGEYLVEYGEVVLKKFKDLKDHVKNMNKVDEGIIRLGASQNFARYMLPDILKAFSSIYNKVQFNVITSWSQSILKMIEKDEVNIAIVRGDITWRHEKILLDQEPICIVYKEKLDLNQLPSLPRINFKTDQGLQQIIDKWWKENFDEPPLVTMDVDSIETCIKLVNNGLGYAIIPIIGLIEYQDIEKLIITDKHNNPLLRDTWLIYKDIDLQYPVLNKFINYLKHNYGKKLQ